MLNWTVNLNPNRLCPDLSLSVLDEGAPLALQHVSALGAQGVRVDVFWHWLEPEPGAFNREAIAWYERFFAETERRGLQVFALLYHPPAWAMTLLERDEAAFLGAWVRFCRLARRLFGDAVGCVQVWNEPNNFLAGLKRDPALFYEKRFGPFSVPVGVRFQTLAQLFAIARVELSGETQLVFNVLANLSPFLPLGGTWLDWETFTDRFLAIAGPHVDVIALDHYPDTWAPGTGPLDWGCLAHAREKVNTPGSPWYAKGVIIGEVGYSSAPNFHLFERPFRWGRFFPRERDEASMATWYAAAMTHLAEEMTPERFPHNRFQMVNVYELFDAARSVGQHPIMRLEDSFGLVRRDGTPKPAFGVLRDVIAGRRFGLDEVPAPELPAYWHLARWGRNLQARLSRGAANEALESRGAANAGGMAGGEPVPSPSSERVAS